MKKNDIYRAVFYMIGLLLLALGITLNTKAGLGVSPIISVAYCISQINDYNLGNTTLGLYSVFVLVELILHTIRQKRLEKQTDDVLHHANRVNRRLILLMDILQIPLSIVFTRFMNLFSDMIPNLGELGNSAPEFIEKLIMLIVALILTGIGAAMSLNMRIVPNPGDGIVQAIADCIHKSVGFTKNCFDVCNVTFTIVISLVCSGKLYGIGVGTILSVIGVGRVIAFFNHFTKEKMTELAGVQD